MKIITVAVTHLTLFACLGLPVNSKQIQEFLPFIQMTAFTSMAVNHGLQASRQLKLLNRAKSK